MPNTRLILLVAVLAACGSSRATDTHVAPTPTATPTTPTPTLTATRAPTHTPRPSPTPGVTETPGPEPTLPFFIATPTPWLACPGTPLTHLYVGGYAAVNPNPPLPNRVRDGPGTGYTHLGYIQPGEAVEILDGPECSGNWTWWQVRSLQNNLTGWTTEGDQNNYFLLPCKPESECGFMSENP